ncbi:MAG TPA: disulfide oxidoreductase [Actinomycetota bacterium]|nr:disulfide oxidoreductase [Actinomycetota bacterium]
MGAWIQLRYRRFFALLTVAADLAAIVAVGWWVASKVSRRARASWLELRQHVADHALPLAFLVALICTLGSLYYSEVAHFIPCKLCWYQRIAMYPLTVILGIAAMRRDLQIRRYVIPIVALGSVISTYHYVIERFPNLAGGSCDPSAPCTVTWVWEFRFISIPFMALGGFALIATLLLTASPSISEEGEEFIDDDEDASETTFDAPAVAATAARA